MLLSLPQTFTFIYSYLFFASLFYRNSRKNIKTEILFNILR